MGEFGHETADEFAACPECSAKMIEALKKAGRLPAQIIKEVTKESPGPEPIKIIEPKKPKSRHLT
jgi:uncharacterized protein with PIN domain